MGDRFESSQVSTTDQPNLTALAAAIVAAFVSRNSLPLTELPGLILSVELALRRLTTNTPSAAASVAEKPEPAVSIRKLVTPDYLICLDDGKQFRSLKRHLRLLGMTPEEYAAHERAANDARLREVKMRKLAIAVLQRSCYKAAQVRRCRTQLGERVFEPLYRSMCAA